MQHTRQTRRLWRGARRRFDRQITGSTIDFDFAKTWDPSYTAQDSIVPWDACVPGGKGGGARDGEFEVMLRFDDYAGHEDLSFWPAG